MMPMVIRCPQCKYTAIIQYACYTLYGGDRKILMRQNGGDRKILGLLNRGDHKISRVNFAQIFSPSHPAVNVTSLNITDLSHIAFDISCKKYPLSLVSVTKLLLNI